jgi:hypothetical protein
VMTGATDRIERGQARHSMRRRYAGT